MAEDWRIVTHGGAGSDAELSSSTREAAELANQQLVDGAAPIEAACEAVAFLEDDGRFNAGRGSYVRDDGETVQMDAACADSTGAFGAVACLERARHPVWAAHAVTETDHLVLAGEGARRFARERELEELEPDAFAGAQGEPSTEDTVGCVVGHGSRFAAALSSGGIEQAMVGRVGDVPLPGCGLRAGPEGAVAATGSGEAIARRRVADRAYQRLADGLPPSTVVAREAEAFEEASIGLIAVDEAEAAGGSNRSMAFTTMP